MGGKGRGFGGTGVWKSLWEFYGTQDDGDLYKGYWGLEEDGGYGVRSDGPDKGWCVRCDKQSTARGVTGVLSPFPLSSFVSRFLSFFLWDHSNWSGMDIRFVILQSR